MPKSMYDIIKNQNGERFAKAIRNYDNGIFDIPNLDKIVRYAGRDAEPIMQYLISLKGVKIQEHAVHMDPIALLSRAGYDAYVADTLSKQNAIRQYFAAGEELCTFHDDMRFRRYHIINAVRKDVDKIRRENFPTPQREDEYGTSVLSIQVLKSGGFISIKNRYNHSVSNPDNTYNSNPDNIIPGLSDAIKHYFDVDFSAQHIELPDEYVVIDDRIFKYICEINNTYVGADFYVKDGIVTPLNPGHQLMLGGGLMLDLQTKTVKNIAGGRANGDFITNAIAGKSVQLVREPNGGKSLMVDGKRFLTVCDGLMTALDVPCTDTVKLEFMNFTDSVDFGRVKNLDLRHCIFNSGFSVNPNAESVQLEDVSAPGKINLRNVDRIELTDNDDLKISNINPNASVVHIFGMDLSCDTLDFSNVKSLKLRGDSWTPIMIKNLTLNPNADNINLGNVRTDGVLDCGNVASLDMSNVRTGGIIVNPSANHIRMSEVSGLSGTVDFSNVDELFLYQIDFSKVDNVIWNRNRLHIGVAPCHPMPAIQNFDFSRVQYLELSSLDFADQNVRFNPNARELVFHWCTGLSGELDFSGVQDLRLGTSNLNDVTNIKLNPNGRVEPSPPTIQQKLKKKSCKTQSCRFDAGPT
ncbi:MAG: hypothetical protein IKW57_02175 [Alphaproteobacteria bacterium]|nr:hypothetical protein [Alphaproteobacteria bacterium]